MTGKLDIADSANPPTFARAGKQVLCEKPIALSADEARRLQAVPAGVRVMEAFMVRFHPQWLRARELVRQGRVGTLRAVQVFFSFFNTDPRNIRNQATTGGGALYDLGCYPIVGSRFLFECEPRRALRSQFHPCLCLVHKLENAVDGRPVLGLEWAPHLKPSSKRLPGPVPLLCVDGCSGLGFPSVHAAPGLATAATCGMRRLPPRAGGERSPTEDAIHAQPHGH